MTSTPSTDRPRPQERRLLATGDPLEGEVATAVEDLVSLSTAVEGDALVVSVSGEVDMLSSPALRALLVETPVPGGVRRVVVDLTRVRFMGSDGLGVLVAAHERLQGEGAPMSVVVAGSAVRRPLEITGLQHLLDVVVADGVADGVAGGAPTQA